MADLDNPPTKFDATMALERLHRAKTCTTPLDAENEALAARGVVSAARTVATRDLAEALEAVRIAVTDARGVETGGYTADLIRDLEDVEDSIRDTYQRITWLLDLCGKAIGSSEPQAAPSDNRLSVRQLGVGRFA